MKIIAAAAIVAFCGVLQIADSNAYLALRKALAEQQVYLLNKTTAILIVQERIASLKDIDEIPLEFKTKATTLFNNATRAIEDKVNAAIAIGKHAELCSATALASLSALNRTVVAEFERTGKNITNNIFEFLHQTDIVIEAARSIGVNLFAISTICHNIDKDEAKACTMRLLGNLSEPIKYFILDADNILRLAESPEALSGQISSLANLRSALRETLTAIGAGIEAIDRAATACIDALHIIQISPPRVGVPGISV